MQHPPTNTSKHAFKNKTQANRLESGHNPHLNTSPYADFKPKKTATKAHIIYNCLQPPYASVFFKIYMLLHKNRLVFSILQKKPSGNIWLSTFV